MDDLGLRRAVDASHLRSLERATEEHAEFEKALLRTHKEVAGLAGEHDRLVRCINPLMAKGNGGPAQPLPSIPQILREILGQSRFGGRPAVMLFSFLDPLVAVVALSTGHTPIVMMEPRPTDLHSDLVCSMLWGRANPKFRVDQPSFARSLIFSPPINYESL